MTSTSSELEVADFLVQVGRSKASSSSSSSSSLPQSNCKSVLRGEAEVEATNTEVDDAKLAQIKDIETKRKQRAEKKAIQLSKGAKVDVNSLKKAQAIALLNALTEKKLLSKVEISVIDQIEEKTRQEDEEEDEQTAVGPAPSNVLSSPQSLSSQPQQPKRDTIIYKDKDKSAQNIPVPFEQFPYQLCQPSKIAHDYIWILDEARRFFRENSFWPSFIGSRIDYELEEKGALPVIVWPEQKQRIAMNTNMKNQKRPRDDDTQSRREDGGDLYDGSGSVSNSDSSDRRGIKRLKTNHSSFMSQIFNTFRWIFGYGSRHGDQSQIKDSPNSHDAMGESAEDVDGRCMIHEQSNQREIIQTGDVKSPVEQYSNDLSQLRLNTFHDLNERGFFVGPADIYGADYSIYVGDPSKGHSVGTVRLVPPKIECIVDKNGDEKIIKRHTISARDILSYSRVQNHVAKMAVYVFDNDQTGNDSTSTDNNNDNNEGSASTDGQNIQNKDLKYLSINFHRVGVRV